jgi:hypothetical protein
MKYTTKTNIRQRSLRPTKKYIITLACAVLFAIGAIVVLELTNTTYWFHKPAAEIITIAGTPTKKPAVNVSGNTPAPTKQPTSNTGNTIGGATAVNGQTSTPTNASQWIVAKSGNITVEQPLANATLHSGSILSGTAKVSVVNFRLIDNSTGVIAEGTLNVVNGNFSGALNFTPHSSSGRLDVFSTDATGVELNEIQITVGF